MRPCKRSHYNYRRENQHLDCKQSLHKSVERPAFQRQSCFVTQMNKKTKGGLGRGEKPVGSTMMTYFPDTTASTASFCSCLGSMFSISHLINDQNLPQKPCRAYLFPCMENQSTIWQKVINSSKISDSGALSTDQFELIPMTVQQEILNGSVTEKGAVPSFSPLPKPPAVFFFSFAWQNMTASEKRAARLIYEGTARRLINTKKLKLYHQDELIS